MLEEFLEVYVFLEKLFKGKILLEKFDDEIYLFCVEVESDKNVVLDVFDFENLFVFEVII